MVLAFVHAWLPEEDRATAARQAPTDTTTTADTTTDSPAAGPQG
jgi:hypothetical protein